ncbi:nucleoside hydrolase [Clostridium sp. MSJ-4]|uniref:Nucleoside hydrolase n=1 Tax=Clostridium simiarum TaxID=2841506 RepID=A0ABS6F450_9CLOT|nr:nucleoside hydrolase [Clostridium simiarum]MBU5592625.1 nucleoside hydrolase [Clostridium simiarum]
MKKIKMILDIDTGIDDALAIAYALGSPEVELIGITGTYGNVLTEQGVQNSLNILNMLGNSNIPVFSGQHHAVDKEHFKTTDGSMFIHGEDGVGNTHIAKSPIAKQQQDGIDFILESCKKYGEELTIVATGPCTNLATAVDRDLETLKLAGNIVIMGGALTVCGNANQFTEANISQDPVSADKLFKSGLPITMIGLDVTLQTLLTKKQSQIWSDLNTTSGKVFSHMVNYYIKAYDTLSPYLGGCGLHDPLAVAVAVDPSLVTTTKLHMKVETEGPSRGRTIGNNEKINEPNPNISVAIGVDVDKFISEFMNRLTTLFSKN